MKKVNAYEVWCAGRPAITIAVCSECRADVLKRWDHVENPRHSFAKCVECGYREPTPAEIKADPLHDLKQKAEDATKAWRDFCHNPSAPTIEERAYQAAKYDVLRAKMVEAKAALALAEKEERQKSGGLTNDVKGGIKALRDLWIDFDSVEELLGALRDLRGDLTVLARSLTDEQFMAAVRELRDSGE